MDKHATLDGQPINNEQKMTMQGQSETIVMGEIVTNYEIGPRVRFCCLITIVKRSD